MAQSKALVIVVFAAKNVSEVVKDLTQEVAVCTIFSAAKPPAAAVSNGVNGLIALIHVSITFVSGGITVLAIFDTVLIKVENTGFRLFSAPETALAIVLKLSIIVFPSSPILLPTSLPSRFEAREEMISTPTSATFGMI